MPQVVLINVGILGIVGPLVWCDYIGASRVLAILNNLRDTTGDPRHRPSPRLARLPGNAAGRRLGSYGTGSRTSMSRKWRSRTTHFEDEKQGEAQPPNESRCRSPKHRGTIAVSIVNAVTDPGVRINTVRHLKNACRRLVSLSGEGLHSRGV